MNYHCADPIKSFGNLISLKWPTDSPASTKMNIEHYAINLLRRIHTADIECYYDCAFDSYKYITDRSRTKEAHNPHNLIVPDRQWGNNFINDTLIHVANIEDAIHEIVETLNSINHTAELISLVYPDGMPTIPPSLNVQKILKEVLTKLDLGPPEDPTRRQFTLYKTHRKERTEKTHLYHPLPNKPIDTSTISECPIPSTTTSAVSVDAFDRRSRLGEAHQALTNFLHYQSHVRFAAAASLPPHISPADDNE
ncbi:hypothetical protein AX14_010270 [Amanita brunnescens Koide BX004]|nr:hypothetical protein AX14_010270 [Amanita brunnescens Koide BX004]